MFRAMQIANYIIHLALEKDIDVTNLHLQKILYYLQAKSLYETGDPLFAESIGKWRLGPVVSNVYHEYKEYGSQPIREIANEIIFDDETMSIKFVEFDVNEIPEEIADDDDIEQSIVSLLKQNPFHLVDKTHEHSPWSEFKGRIESGERGLEYTNEEIREYFIQYPEKLEEVMGDG
ncbi:Panacea domain-containing protein [Virgibacillus kimchii]